MNIRSLTNTKISPLKKGDTGGFALYRRRKSPPALLCQKGVNRRFFWIVGVIFFLSACAPFKDTPYLEKEFGKDSQAAWDAQIIHKDHPNAEKLPEEMAGITAEEVMSVRNKMFAEKPKKSSAFEFNMGKAE